MSEVHFLQCAITEEWYCSTPKLRSKSVRGIKTTVYQRKQRTVSTDDNAVLTSSAEGPEGRNQILHVMARPSEK